MASRIQLRRDTAANWASVNPILAQGEFGYEIDTNLAKVGNGTDAWDDLPYFGGGGSGTGTVTSVNVTGGTTGLTTSGGPITTTGTITLGGILSQANGGTSFSTYTSGDIIYASATNTLSKRTIGSVGQVLTVFGGQPTWMDIPAISTGSIIAGTGVSITGTLTNRLVGTGNITINATGGGSGSGTVTSVGLSGGTTGLSVSGSPITTSGTFVLDGTVNTTHGGTGLSNYVVGDILYCSSTDALARRAVGTNGQVLTVSGGVPVWANPASASLPQNKLTQNTIVPQDTSYIIAKQFDTNGFSMVINGHLMVIG